MGSTGGVRKVGRWFLVTAAALAFVALFTVSAAIDPTAAAVGDYVALGSPVRLVDTRPGATTIDGQDAGIGLRGAGSTTEVQIAGRGGIPADASIAVLTVTAVDPQANAFLTVHPNGTPRPNASNVNYNAGHNTANTVLGRLGTDGKVSIYTFAPTQLIVDVAGYFPAGTAAALQSPVRLVDTRPGATTIDGQDAGIGLRAAGSTLDVQVAGRAGVPADASVAVLTVTAVDPQANAFLIVHPTGTARPNASNVNFNAGHNTANTVLARIGTDGKVSIYSFAATHFIVDVAGHLPASVYTPLPAPARLADTRPGATTIDGQQAGTGLVLGGHSLQVHVAGRAGIPADASTAVLTVAAVDPQANAFLTVHPNGTPRPNASNVNYNTGHNKANTVLARIGAGGDVCIFTQANTHLIVDVAGYLTGPPPPAVGPVCPAPATNLDLSDKSLPSGPVQPPAPPTTGPHAFIFQNVNFPGTIGRWDPCRPVQQIKYAINPARATQEHVDQMFVAMRELETYTGFDFVPYQANPTTSEGLDDRRPPTGADFLVGFSDPSLTPSLAGPVLGVGGGFWFPSTGEVSTGFIIVDVPDATPGDLLRTTLIHEFGHAMGLGHVNDASQIMHGLAGTVIDLQGGDKEGLWWMGTAQSCLSAPLLRTGEQPVLVERTVGDGRSGSWAG